MKVPVKVYSRIELPKDMQAGSAGAKLWLAAYALGRIVQEMGGETYEVEVV